MHVASVLPPELFDESIDHLWDDPKSLAACALTCRDWIGTSRLHLFRTVRIQNASQCARFEALLQSTPAIARCVRRFTVSAEYKGVDEAGRSVEDDAWVNAVGGFVHRLERVTTIGLSRVRWHALLPETQAAFMDRFAHVRTLFLFEHLRTIQLCWREIENMKVVGDLLHASGASLERLLVEFPSGVPEEAVLDNQISLVHNTGLRSVRFGGLDAKAAASQGFMSNQLFPWVTAMISQISSPQLEEISFEFEITSVADLLSLDWSRIDHDLSREEYKGLLVYFFVVCQDMTPKVEKEIRNLIADRLHGLCERGTLCVSCV
ncbi:hypothetical protein EVJ58_g2276 [Rhodofomes roseus]|uniref:F-box domain-containing protein n=1 Tax=Rhodofomes roseus TaxID=34475 RepID=A0A4Y9YT77_9APHY|nr:hypothetical protein EVJ58_g2276 [Rhodofomes roseus]